MKIGYSTLSMKATPWHVFLPALPEIGYTAIALDVSPGGDQRPSANDLAALTPQDRRTMRAECESRGIEIDAVMGRRSLLSRDPAEAAANMQRLKQTVDFCLEVTPRGQRVRYADEPEPPGWRIPGNGSGQTQSPAPSSTSGSSAAKASLISPPSSASCTSTAGRAPSATR